jgi:uncharacterized protein (UPF0262 family)
VEDRQRIAKISLDEQSVILRSPQVEHERKVAIYDLLEDNTFILTDGQEGPYNLHLGIEDNRLIFDVRDEAEKKIKRIILPGSSFRRVVKDYFLIVESYFNAIKTKAPSQIEAIDMARRGIHNDGADLLMERMASDVEMDKDTSRRLFTLVCVLHIRA